MRFRLPNPLLIYIAAFLQTHVATREAICCDFKIFWRLMAVTAKGGLFRYGKCLGYCGMTRRRFTLTKFYGHA